MADPTRNTSGRSTGRRVLSEIVDRAFLANRGHDYQSGYWDKKGAIQGGVQSGLGAVNPMLGLIARLYYNHQNRNAGNMPLQQQSLDPTGSIPYNYGGPSPQSGFGGIQTGGYQSPTFDPNNPFAMPQRPQQPAQGQQPGGFGVFTPRPMSAPSGFVSRLSNQGGGARGMHSQGGYIGDSARSMFDSMRRAQYMPIDPQSGPMQS